MREPERCPRRLEVDPRFRGGDSLQRERGINRGYLCVMLYGAERGCGARLLIHVAFRLFLRA